MALSLIRSKMASTRRNARSYRAAAPAKNDISYDEAGVRRLFELSDLHSVAAQLKNDPKIISSATRMIFCSVPRPLLA